MQAVDLLEKLVGKFPRPRHQFRRDVCFKDFSEFIARPIFLISGCFVYERDDAHAGESTKKLIGPAANSSTITSFEPTGLAGCIQYGLTDLRQNDCRVAKCC